ncbi:MAG: Dam family site-specific DNA-(adenine-N6)-methyltransferase [Ignavibacteriae bacterium]|nr:Dam family site-specific DNA-(adenine-N6)-methyltransferase [Ignavibacteriota bacterium]
MNLHLNESIKPFIRWAGGKQNLINEIFKFVNGFKINRYFEPFLGGGSFFLKGSFSKAYLSDMNSNLINTYNQIKYNYKDVYNGLKKFRIPVSEKTYYRIRENFNRSINEPTLDQAIKFIFLNKTSFNGIYRVNKSGNYNVPFGKSKPSFLPLEQFKILSEKLNNAEIFTSHYQEIISLVEENDLVYLDPPYPRISSTASFNHYTLEKFDEEEHGKVALFAEKLSKKGCKVIISNADVDSIKELYSNWDIYSTNAYRYISCKKDKIKVKELIIKNY